MLNSIDSVQVSLYFSNLFINFTSSFSKLKLVKNYLGSTMSQDRLVDLARLSIESEIARKINFDVITRLALKKARKAPLNAIVKSCSNFAIV